MSSFTDTTIKFLIAGALVLGAGVYYQGYASSHLKEAQMALRKVDAARSRADMMKHRAEQYVSLIEKMADNKTDRQEPISVDSEFSAQEISQVGPMLDTLYQRDGRFFLQHFELAWRDGNDRIGLLPRVALDLQGRKVLLFSEEATAASSVKIATR
jgi:hypothetical protein